MYLKDNKILDDIKDYCRENGIRNVQSFVYGLIVRGFAIEKYGTAPGMIVKESDIPNRKNEPAYPEYDITTVVKEKQTEDVSKVEEKDTATRSATRKTRILK